MIVVNLKHSMKRLIDQVRVGIEDQDLLRQLERDTTTEWSGVSSKGVYAHGGHEERDYVLGIYGDQVVSAYNLRGWHPGEEPGRVVFNVERAVELAGAVGQPVPGGRWKRGEARPVRYLQTAPFLEDLDKAGVLDAYDNAGDDAVDRRMVEVVRALAAPAGGATFVAPLDGVEVETDPRGGIRVIVPLGTKVTVVQRAPAVTAERE